MEVAIVQYSCWVSLVFPPLQAAAEGAAETVSMTARAGRASYVNTSLLVNPDPGAQAVALWMEAIHAALEN